MSLLPDNHWCARRQLGPEPTDPELRQLLYASGSLTRQLRRRYGSALELTLLSQQWRLPWHNESRLLELTPGRYALIREVSMTCHRQPVLYARTLLPPQALRGNARRLLSSGQRPLGALLFGARGRLSIRQERRDYARLDRDNPLQHRISELLTPIAQPLWARRTVYRSRAMHFAIIEVFLPAIGAAK